MSTKRKSVEGKADPNKRTKRESINEQKEIAATLVAEDITTARERARLWHEQQMKLAGMRAVEEKIANSHESEVTTRTTRTRSSRLSEIKVDRPVKRDVSNKRHSEMPTVVANRTRSHENAVKTANDPLSPPIATTTRTKSRDSNSGKNVVTESTTFLSVDKEITNHTAVPSEPAQTLPASGENRGGFKTIEERMNSQPTVLAEISSISPQSIPPSEEIPPEFSWVSLPSIAFFCVIVAICLMSIFRTEQFLLFIQQLKLRLLRFNHDMTTELGPAPFNLDYTTWLSGFGIVLLFTFVL